LIAIAALLSPSALAAPLPEPTLRLTPAITVPSAEFPAEERAVLRVEYLAAQTRMTEADIVGDILGRVRRMDAMIKDIRTLVDARPQPELAQASNQAPLPGAAATTGPAHAKPLPSPPPLADDSTAFPDETLILRALMASVILFLFWLLGKRHNYFKAQRLKAAAEAPDHSAPPTLIPEDDALVAEPPQPAPPPVEIVHAAFEPPAEFKPIEPVAARPVPAMAPAAQPIVAPLDLVTIADFVPAMPASAPQKPAIEPGTDQSLELAEIMVSMGLAQGAADALSERIRSDPRRALYHWLKLLDVYRRSDMKEEFERTAQELRQSFNVQPEDWTVQGSGSISLEDYPHLAAQLQQLWPTPACAGFLQGLLEDNRGGTRHGFPQSVAEEILLLEKLIAREATSTPA
jgi:hypothetical protein